MFKNLTAGSLILASFLAISFSAFAAEIQRIEIAPESLSSGQIKHRGAHQVAWRQGLVSELLLVTLGGTNSRPQDMKAISRVAIELGYQTIGLDYNNSVISTTCATSIDANCFDLFRQAVIEGRQGSKVLQVDVANSLESRLRTILSHLNQQEPAVWGRFLNSDTEEVHWEKIVVIGHSQGSGHAAYLAKKHPLKGAILLAGPQDRFADPAKEVAWLTSQSQTPPNKYFGLIHEKDFFGAEFQLQGLAALRNETGRLATTLVNLEAPSEPGPTVLVSNAEVRDGHMAVIGEAYAPLWRYLLLEAAQ